MDYRKIMEELIRNKQIFYYFLILDQNFIMLYTHIKEKIKVHQFLPLVVQ